MAYLRFIQNYTLASFAVFFIALPLFLSIFRYAHLNKAFRLLFIFLCLDLFVGLWMFHLAAHRINNIVILNIFVPFRYILYSGMFYHNIKSEKYKRIILPTLIVFGPFAILDIYASNNDLTDMHNHLVGKYSQVVESALIILWVLLYFYELIKSLDIANIISYPFFWICAGLLIFYSGNIFYFPFWHYMNKWENDLQLGFMEEIPYVVEIISLFMFSIGIWLTRSQQHDSSQS